MKAAPPAVATPLYEAFLDEMRGQVPGRVEQGVFGAEMEVDSVNAGPVTLVLERA